MHRLDSRNRAGWWRALAFVVVGNLPDVDFLFGFLGGEPGAYHRGFTHTVLAAVVFGVVAGTFVSWRRWDRWCPATLLCGAAYASHLLLDAFTEDRRGAAGARFFWPLSDAYYISPVTIFREIFIDGGSRLGFVHSIVAWPTLWVLAREAAIVVVALATLRIVELVRAARREAAPGDLAPTGEEDLA